MRQICPNCLNAIEVPAAAVGRDFDCPVCGKPFPVPKGYQPSVAAGPTAAPPTLPDSPWSEPTNPRPAPPPGLIPPSHTVAAGSLPPPGGMETGLESTTLVTLVPNIVCWIPVACLTLCLVLTFFPWVGSFPGGYRVFSQSALEASVGDVSSTGTAAPPELQDAEKSIRELAPPNLLLLLYLVLLILTVILAWVERVVKQTPDVRTVPGALAWVPGVWPYRFALLTGLAALLLVLVLLQSLRGFGLQTAVVRHAQAKHDSALKAADTAAKQQAVEIQIGMDAARFAVQSTTVRSLAVTLHVVAVLAILARLWLARRGDQPPPRLVLQQ